MRVNPSPCCPVRMVPSQIDFPDEYRRWGACDPLDLYDIPVQKKVPNVSEHSSHASARLRQIEESDSSCLVRRELR